MMILFFSTIILLILISMLTLILSLTSKKMMHEREKASPFECGFDPLSNTRLPFSLHFFLIAMIFLIFDVELTLLFPMVMSMKINNMKYHLIIISTFIFILLVGLFHEWKQGALDWTI